MELNREKIIKALEHCFNDKPCSECEWHEAGNGCLGKLNQSALALIKELSEENERLRAELADAEDEAEKAIDIAEGNIRAEIASCGTSCHWCEDKVRADTVRQMQERLTSFFAADDTLKHIEVDAEYINSRIDKIAKEMEGI